MTSENEDLDKDKFKYLGIFGELKKKNDEAMRRERYLALTFGMSREERLKKTPYTNQFENPH